MRRSTLGVLELITHPYDLCSGLVGWCRLSHGFSVRGLVLDGEFIVTCGGEPHSYRPGDVFEVAAGLLHDEVFLGEGGDVTIDVSNDMNRKQLSVFGSWTFSKNGQADCARFISDRKLDVDSLFTHSWPLERAAEAYELFDTQTTGKGVLIPA